MCDVIFCLFDSQTQGADKSHKPNLCLPLLSFKLMICRRLHFPPKQDIVCLSSRASFCLQHKLDWWSDSLLIRLILQSTCSQETRTSCFVRRTEQSFNKSRWRFASEQWPHEDQEWFNFTFCVRRHQWQIQPWRYANGKPGPRQGQAHRQFTFNSASGETNQFPSL